MVHSGFKRHVSGKISHSKGKIMKTIDGEAGLEFTDSEPPEAKIMAAASELLKQESG